MNKDFKIINIKDLSFNKQYITIDDSKYKKSGNKKRIIGYVKNE